MSASPCERLEDYLENTLPGPERAEFEGHLPACPKCRQAIQVQGRLDQLLARAVVQSHLEMPGLVDRVEQQWCRAQRRWRVRWVAGLAAAAILVGCLTAWRFLPLERKLEPAPAPLVERPSAPPDVTRPLVQVTFEPEDAVIAQRLPTTDPAVTIIWLYPAVQLTDQPKTKPFISASNP